MQKTKGNFIFYFILTLLFSSLSLNYYFGDLFERPNTTFFGAEGDGLLTYYTASFHVKQDSLYFHQDALNYPYGESVFFTGCLPLFTNTIKIIQPLVDVTDYTVAIINIIMLLSIVVCALFLYLIFRKLNLPGFYSALCATAISFLSPQIDRLGGHYALTFQFAIPCMIYLLLLFREKPNMQRSVLISLFTFFMASTHIYFFAFFSVLISYYFLHKFIKKESVFSNWKFVFKHVFVQIILPFIVIQFLIKTGNDISDRTTTPYGYLVYKSKPTGVFWPNHKVNYNFMNNIYADSTLEWEGLSFIGFAASLFFLVFLAQKLTKLFLRKTKQINDISDNADLNIFFSAACISLLISFGVPFIFGLSRLLDYLGLIKQFRGVARFAWNFFYIINIVLVYVAYKKLSSSKKWIAYSGFTLLIGLLCLDAHLNASAYATRYNNQMTSWTADAGMPWNEWEGKVSAKTHQAILPLPYFNTGSENISIDVSDPQIKQWAFEASLRTGLPLFANYGSRTSLSQTYACVPLALEPLASFPFLKELPNQKPLLVLTNGQNLNSNEQRILNVSKCLYKTTRYAVYELRVADLTKMKTIYFQEIQEQKNAISQGYTFNGMTSNDSILNYCFEGYESSLSSLALEGKGALSGELSSKALVLFDASPPNLVPDSPYLFSFWMHRFKKDMFPRSTLEICPYDAQGKAYDVVYNLPSSYVKSIVGDWALLEGTVRFKNKGDKLKISIWNKEIIGNNPVEFDNFLLRPSSASIFYTKENKLYFNNRIFNQNQ